MTGRDCRIVRDLFPGLVGGSIAPEDDGMVEAHLGICPSCREELEVVEALYAGRPEVPAGLGARIQAYVREEFSAQHAGGLGEGSPEQIRVIPIGRFRRIPGWALSAAAVVILALGTSVIWSQRSPDVLQDPIVVASQEPLPEDWLWDDGMVAGAPVFDGLSDEELAALLKEFEG